MTRHELLHQVALAIMGIDTQQKTPMPHHLQYAENVLSTIFAAVNNPTEAMARAGCQSDDPLGALVDWKRENCTTREAVVNVWQAMLAASPLAPQGGSD